MRGARAALVLLGLVVLGTVAGCTGTPASPDGSAGGTGEVGKASVTPSVQTSSPAPVPTPTVVQGCPQLRNLVVGTPATPLADYEEIRVQLSDGRYTSTDGDLIELVEPCAFGDLNGDGSADAVGAVTINTGGTGRFSTLVVWVRDGGSFELEASLALGDRNPVIEIPGVSGAEVTVVYLTRTDDMPMAALNVKRTATFELTPTGLVETGHEDEPYNPLIDG